MMDKKFTVTFYCEDGTREELDLTTSEVLQEFKNRQLDVPAEETALMGLAVQGAFKVSGVSIVWVNRENNRLPPPM